MCAKVTQYGHDHFNHQVEVAVLGQFAFGQVLKEAQVAAGGGISGINHVAHLSGAGAGVLLVVTARGLLSRMEGEAETMFLIHCFQNL